MERFERYVSKEELETFYKEGNIGKLLMNDFDRPMVAVSRDIGRTLRHEMDLFPDKIFNIKIEVKIPKLKEIKEGEK